VVYAGPFLAGGARSAEVLLPATAWAEEDGTFVNFEGRSQRVRRCHPPRGEARPGWRIAVDLAEAAGVELPRWTSDREVLADLSSVSERFAGLDAEGMGLLGVPAGGGAATRA
jgi:predicted molibdopterin-dependent oxidoreductase YjgC